MQQVIKKTAIYNQKRYKLNIQPMNVSSPQPQETLNNIRHPVFRLKEERGSCILPKIVYDAPHKSLIQESRSIFEWVTARGYGTRNIQYELSKINARLEIAPISMATSYKQQDAYIVRGKVRVPLSALGKNADNQALYSYHLLKFLDRKRWQQHDLAAAWFTRLINLQKSGPQTTFEQLRLVAHAKKPKRQYLVDIHSELSCPIQLYQAIKHFFCQRSEYFPAWLSLQGIRRIKEGLGTAIINDDTIKPPDPSIGCSRLSITLPLIKSVQRLDAIINPDIPISKPYKMTVEQEMDMARKLQRFDLASFTTLPPPFKSANTKSQGNSSPSIRHGS